MKCGKNLDEPYFIWLIMVFLLHCIRINKFLFSQCMIKFILPWIPQIMSVVRSLCAIIIHIIHFSVYSKYFHKIQLHYTGFLIISSANSLALLVWGLFAAFPWCFVLIRLSLSLPLFLSFFLLSLVCSCSLLPTPLSVFSTDIVPFITRIDQKHHNK